MKRFIMVVLLALGFLFGWPYPQAEAQSFEIINYDVLVEIQRDGSAYFTESVTYDFEGDWNGVLFNLDISEIESPTDVRVSMQAEGQQDAFPFSLSNSGEPGTFQLENTGEFLNFTVYNPMSDEVQTVHYQYRLPEIITNYNDTAELNRRVIGTGWDQQLNDVDVTILLPQAVEEGELRAWAHGDLSGTVFPENNDTVRIALDQNPSNTFVEAHVIFPTYVTAENPNVVAEDKLDEILAQERALAEGKERQRQIGLIAGLVLGIFGPVFAVAAFMWIRKKRRQTIPQPAHIPTHLYELPADITPAVMKKAVYAKEPGSEEITATVMDLVRKGYLRIEEDGPQEKKGLFGKAESSYVLYQLKEPGEELLHHETRLLRWFIDVVGDGEKVALRDFENIGSTGKRAVRFRHYRETWQHEVGQEAHELHKVYQASYGGKATALVVFSFILNIAFFIGSLILIGVLGVPWWLLLLPLAGILVSIILAIYLVRHPALTYEGDRARKEWDSFANMLRNVGNFSMREVGSIVLWDHFLVYAIALGEADKVMKQLQMEFPQEELQTSYFGGYYYNPYLFYGAMNQSVSRGIASSTPSSSSNAGGFGGGFSGGSSGGSGGGSGGGAF